MVSAIVSVLIFSENFSLCVVGAMIEAGEAGEPELMEIGECEVALGSNAATGEGESELMEIGDCRFGRGPTRGGDEEGEAVYLLLSGSHSEGSDLIGTLFVLMTVVSGSRLPGLGPEDSEYVFCL